MTLPASQAWDIGPRNPTGSDLPQTVLVCPLWNDKAKALAVRKTLYAGIKWLKLGHAQKHKESLINHWWRAAAPAQQNSRLLRQEYSGINVVTAQYYHGPSILDPSCRRDMFLWPSRAENPQTIRLQWCGSVKICHDVVHRWNSCRMMASDPLPNNSSCKIARFKN